jgi:hypothetical protein
MGNMKSRHDESDDFLDSDIEISDESRIDYIRYAQIVWNHRKPIAIGAAFGLVLGFVLLHIIHVKYQATLVVEAPTSSANELGSLASGLASGLGGGGLGSMAKMALGKSIGAAGDSFSGASQNDFTDFQTLLDSNRLSEALLKDQPGAMHHLFDSDWDPDAKQWSLSVIDVAMNDILTFLFAIPANNTPGPTVMDVKTLLEHDMEVDSDPVTGNLTIVFGNKDPKFARDFLMAIYKEADSLVAADVRERAQKRIDYLNKLLPTIAQDDLRAALIGTLSSLDQQMVTVQADKYYSAVPIDLPVIPEMPNMLKVMLILAGSTLLCAAVAGFVVIRMPERVAKVGGAIRRWTGRKDTVFQN